jgi:REP element-mobilizing transposase RayT
MHNVPDHPLAYFITIRTYGTWLSGDRRGSVDDEHRGFNTPFKQRDDFRANYQRRAMKSKPIVVTPAMRSIIEAEIQRTCSYRGWELLALNVRTNHVHIVVSAGVAPEAVMRELKVYATRALRTAGLTQSSVPGWASHGSTRYAWTESEAEACISYSLDAQGNDLPGSGWRRTTGGVS